MRPAASNPYYDPRPNPYLQQAPSIPSPPDVALVRSNAEAGFNEAEKDFQRGIESLGPSVDRSLAALQGAFGFEEAAQANLAEARQAEQALVANERLRPHIARYRDVQSFAGYVDWGLSVGAEHVPLALSMLASGALGRWAEPCALGASLLIKHLAKPQPGPEHRDHFDPIHGMGMKVSLCTARG